MTIVKQLREPRIKLQASEVSISLGKNRRPNGRTIESVRFYIGQLLLKDLNWQKSERFAIDVQEETIKLFKDPKGLALRISPSAGGFVWFTPWFDLDKTTTAKRFEASIIDEGEALLIKRPDFIPVPKEAIKTQPNERR